MTGRAGQHGAVGWVDAVKCRLGVIRWACGTRDNATGVYPDRAPTDREVGDVGDAGSKRPRDRIELVEIGIG